MDAVQQAIANARTVAEAAPAPVIIEQANTAVAPVGMGRPKSLADATANYVERPEIFIKVDEYGLHIEDKGIINEIYGTLSLKDCKFPEVCRFMRAGQAAYLRTYDGIREVTSGKSWAQALEDARRIDQKADIYNAVDFVIDLTHEIKKQGPAQNAAAIPPVGSRLGHTTSRTGYDTIMKLVKSVYDSLGEDAVVQVRLFPIAKTKGSNSWGIVGMELVTKQ